MKGCHSLHKSLCCIQSFCKLQLKVVRYATSGMVKEHNHMPCYDAFKWSMKILLFVTVTCLLQQGILSIWSLSAPGNLAARMCRQSTSNVSSSTCCCSVLLSQNCLTCNAMAQCVRTGCLKLLLSAAVTSKNVSYGFWGHWSPKPPLKPSPACTNIC